MVHQLKIKRPYFMDILYNRKRFEVRFNDRNYQVGDFLGLNEVDEDNKETGHCEIVRVLDVFDDPEYCKPGYVIMSIEPTEIYSCIKDYRTKKGEFDEGL